MKIAIDVHSLGTQAGGNETYFRQLLWGLGNDPGRHQYTLFYTRAAAREAVGGDPRFSYVQVPENPLVRLGLSLPSRLARLKPDVFHCQYIQPLWGRTPTVVSIHDLAYEHFPHFFNPAEALRLKVLVRRTARKAGHILTLSEFSANDIAQRYGVPREKITVTHLAASEQFRPRAKQPCREHLARQYGIEAPFILYVGRIQARKNLPRLVEAFARLRKQGLEARLVLVGKKDWQFEKLLAAIREFKVEDSVIFPGYVAQEDLPLFYNAAEVFVFPSFFEGFGLPVIESMASGVPTITSLGSSLGEVAGDGALLVDPEDTSAITSALEKVLGSTELQQHLIEHGLRRASEFKPENLARQALKVYQSFQ